MQEPLRAGASMRDITPEAGLSMWGYLDRPGVSTGTLDPLFVRTVALGGAGGTYALVVLDLGRAPMPEVRARLRERAKAHGVDDVILMATHTHGGPVLELGNGGYVAYLEEAIAESIAEAAANLGPANLRLGTGMLDIGHNRRVIVDGKCYMLWRNEERLPTSPVDQEMTLLVLERPSGEAVASLVHYACHPVVLGPDNLEYSGDWSGVMCRQVEAERDAPCLFLQGGAGDINPYLDKTPREEGGVASMRATGKEAGRAVLRALEQSVLSKETPVMQYREGPVEVGTRWDFQDEAIAAVFNGIYGPMFDKYQQVLTHDMALPAGALALTPELGLAFVPGEFFVQFQLDLKARTPMRHALLCGYANDFHLYFPTIAGAAAGGYGGSSATYVAASAGARMTAQCAEMLCYGAGKLEDTIRLSTFMPVDYDPEQHGPPS